MLGWIAVNTSWMYWTWQSAATIGGLFAAITLMGIWDAFSPSVPRNGFLPIKTTRGDRFFIGIISMIALFLLWLGFIGAGALWVPIILSIVWFCVLGLWG